MSREQELTQSLLEAYQRTGEELGYWAARFREAVKRKGGLATAKRMLQPRSPEQRKGLDVLLNAGRPELTTEAILLQPKFRPLFSKAELQVAAERLGRYKKDVEIRARKRERLYPDELEAGPKYCEGARKQIRINAYERNSRARLACLKHHGYRCAVCDLLMEEQYGKIGKKFIHVHHLTPLGLCDGAYKLDPVKDLRPVCPNCHAVLHHQEQLLSIAELKAIIERVRLRRRRIRPSRRVP